MLQNLKDQGKGTWGQIRNELEGGKRRSRSLVEEYEMEEKCREEGTRGSSPGDEKSSSEKHKGATKGQGKQKVFRYMRDGSPKAEFKKGDRNREGKQSRKGRSGQIQS